MITPTLSSTYARILTEEPRSQGQDRPSDQGAARAVTGPLRILPDAS